MSETNLWRALGPGLITGASDDDPSGIATYSQAGAQFGYGLAWTMLYIWPLMVAIQLVAADIGRVTGTGIAGVLRRHYPRWLLLGAVALLTIANTINLGADLGAMADATTLLLPLPRPLYVVAFAILCATLEVFVQYKRYVSILKWLCTALLAYFASAAVVHVNWPAAFLNLVWPVHGWSPAGLATIVAVFGTTISPYCFFWQSSEEAEDVAADAARTSLIEAPAQAPAALRRIEVDTLGGMAFSNLVSVSIIVITAATLNAHGLTNITSSAQAAQALRPLAGRFAATLFTLGILGTGLLAVPVLAGSCAYAIGEALDWPTGLGRQPGKAKRFYGTIVAVTLLGTLINFSPVNPIRALVLTAILNGLVAVPLMAIMMLISQRHDIMGPFTTKPATRTLGWLATLVMAAAAVGMFIA